MMKTDQRLNSQGVARTEVGLGKGHQGFHYKPQLLGHPAHPLSWRLLHCPQPPDPFVVK